MLTTIITVISLLLLLYFAWGVGFQFFLAVAGCSFRETGARNGNSVKKFRRFGIFIPAYREDGVIVDTARKALEQDYPKDYFEVIVIADHLKEDTLIRLRELPIRLIEINFQQSTKSRALNAALETYSAGHFDSILILDADNIMARDCLHQFNRGFDSGRLVLQGQRVPKNLDTPFSILDGASEAINNHLLCRGPAALGLSARLAGSGMAFDYDLFTLVMPHISAIGGFDKELELRLTRLGLNIGYVESALIYDEKVRNSRNFSRQRGRWIAAQFQYASRYLFGAVAGWWKEGNVDHLHKALQMVLPPRLLTPGILAAGAVLFGLLGLKALALAWGVVLVFNIATFMLALPSWMWKFQNLWALRLLPLAFLAAMYSLLLLGKAKRQFLHTPHSPS